MAIDIATVKGIVSILAPVALEKAKGYWGGNHGSKVKMGAFQECKVEMFGDKACIVVDPERGEIILLTSDYIQSCQFVKEKFKKLKMKTYYYYEIVYKDGKQSYVRMSGKYRDAMTRHM